MSTYAILEGWLLKSPPEKKLVRARWTQRWFVLRESGKIPGQHVLEYYDNPKQSKKHPQKPCRSIDLDQCEQVDANVPCQPHDDYEHMFSLHTQERRYYLMSKTEDEMIQWVQALCRACGLLQADSSSNPTNNNPATNNDHADENDDNNVVFSELPAASAAAAAGRRQPVVNNSVMLPAANRFMPSNAAAAHPFNNFHGNVNNFMVATEDETSAGSDATITNVNISATTVSNNNNVTTNKPFSNSIAPTNATKSRPPPLSLNTATTSINTFPLGSMPDIQDPFVVGGRYASRQQQPKSQQQQFSSTVASLPFAPPPPVRSTSSRFPAVLQHAVEIDKMIADTEWSKKHAVHRRTGSESPYFHLRDFRSGITCSPLEQNSVVAASKLSSSCWPSTTAFERDDDSQVYSVPPVPIALPPTTTPPPPPPSTQIAAGSTTPSSSSTMSLSAVSSTESPSTAANAARLEKKPSEPNQYYTRAPGSATAAAAAAGSKPTVPTKPEFLSTSSKIISSSDNNSMPQINTRQQQTAKEDVYALPVEHIYSENKKPVFPMMSADFRQLSNTTSSNLNSVHSIQSSVSSLQQQQQPSPSSSSSASRLSLLATTTSGGQSPRQMPQHSLQSNLHGPMTQPRNVPNSNQRGTSGTGIAPLLRTTGAGVVTPPTPAGAIQQQNASPATSAARSRYNINSGASTASQYQQQQSPKMQLPSTPPEPMESSALIYDLPLTSATTTTARQLSKNKAHSQQQPPGFGNTTSRSSDADAESSIYAHPAAVAIAVPNAKTRNHDDDDENSAPDDVYDSPSSLAVPVSTHSSSEMTTPTKSNTLLLPQRSVKTEGDDEADDISSSSSGDDDVDDDEVALDDADGGGGGGKRPSAFNRFYPKPSTTSTSRNRLFESHAVADDSAFNEAHVICGGHAFQSDMTTEPVTTAIMPASSSVPNSMFSASSLPASAATTTTTTIVLDPTPTQTQQHRASSISRSQRVSGRSQQHQQQQQQQQPHRDSTGSNSSSGRRQQQQPQQTQTKITGLSLQSSSSPQISKGKSFQQQQQQQYPAASDADPSLEYLHISVVPPTRSAAPGQSSGTSATTTRKPQQLVDSSMHSSVGSNVEYCAVNVNMPTTSSSAAGRSHHNYHAVKISSENSVSSSLSATTALSANVGSGSGAAAGTSSSAPHVPPRSPLVQQQTSHLTVVGAATSPGSWVSTATAPITPPHSQQQQQHRRSSSSSLGQNSTRSSSTSANEPQQQQQQQQQHQPFSSQPPQQQQYPGSLFTVGRHLHSSTRSNTSGNIVMNTKAMMSQLPPVAAGTADQYHEIDGTLTDALKFMRASSGPGVGGGASSSSTISGSSGSGAAVAANTGSSSHHSGRGEGLLRSMLPSAQHSNSSSSIAGTMRR